MGGSAFIGSSREVVVIERSPLLAEALVLAFNRAGLRGRTLPCDAPLPRGLRDTTVLLDADVPGAQERRAELRERGCAVVLLVEASSSADDRHPSIARDAPVEELVARLCGERVPLRQTARPRHHPGAENGVRALTMRERHVLECLLAGAGGEATAQELGISPHTVRTHVQNILGKLQVSSRHEAGVIALEAGMRPRRLRGAAVGAAS